MHFPNDFERYFHYKLKYIFCLEIDLWGTYTMYKLIYQDRTRRKLGFQMADINLRERLRCITIFRDSAL